MRVRSAALLAASVVATGVVASSATAAGPPPPTGVGGAKVSLFASGVHTPTSFAFGGGTVFEGDGGVDFASVSSKQALGLLTYGFHVAMTVPADEAMFNVQRIFYYHLPSAWVFL